MLFKKSLSSSLRTVSFWTLSTFLLGSAFTGSSHAMSDDSDDDYLPTYEHGRKVSKNKKSQPIALTKKREKREKVRAAKRRRTSSGFRQVEQEAVDAIVLLEPIEAIVVFSEQNDKVIDSGKKRKRSSMTTASPFINASSTTLTPLAVNSGTDNMRQNVDQEELDAFEYFLSNANATFGQDNPSVQAKIPESPSSPQGGGMEDDDIYSRSTTSTTTTMPRSFNMAPQWIKLPPSYHGETQIARHGAIPSFPQFVPVIPVTDQSRLPSYLPGTGLPNTLPSLPGMESPASVTYFDMSGQYSSKFYNNSSLSHPSTMPSGMNPSAFLTPVEQQTVPENEEIQPPAARKKHTSDSDSDIDDFPFDENRTEPLKKFDFKSLSAQQKMKIIKKCNDFGWSAPRTGTVLGIADSSVKGWWKKMDLKSKFGSYNPSMSEEELQLSKELTAAGWAPRQVAKKVAYTAATIGTKVKDVGRPIVHTPSLTIWQMNEIKKLGAPGTLSPDEISSLTEASLERVVFYLEALKNIYGSVAAALKTTDGL